MFKNISKLTIAAAAVLALPGMAQAGTSTASGTATLGVVSQCSVTGANVNLGTFTVNDTWQTVGDQLGASYTMLTYSPGSRGVEYLNFGSVTCDAGTPYSLTIKGTGTVINETIRLTVGGKTVTLYPAIKKVGATTLADSQGGFPVGVWAWLFSGISATGTGAPQALIGNSLLHIVSSPGTLTTDKLGTAGTFSDTLTYTLHF